MSDLIDRQDAIDAIKGLPTWWADEGGYYGGAQPPMEALLDPEDAVSAIENLPSAQSNAIPLEWIAKHLEWLDNCDNDFAQLAKVAIRAMVEIWKKDKTQ